MSYNAKVQFSYVNDSESTPSKYFPEIVDKHTITIEAPAQDMNVHQYYDLFRGFLRAVGFAEYSIMDGACRLAFSDSNEKMHLDKLMEEYELQDKQIYTVEDYVSLMETYEESLSKIKNLEARLSLTPNPDNPQYTDEELDAMPMFVEFPTETSVTAKTLQEAYQVCNQCGTEYGEYSVGCSSHWTGKCDVCGETKSVTEARDYGYLEKGIKEIANRFDDETLPEPSTGNSQVSPVTYDEQVNQTPLTTSHEALEELAEEAEDFLYDRDIELTSHSYENIIQQAQQHGFKV
jgi:hypothetical protein